MPSKRLGLRVAWMTTMVVPSLVRDVKAVSSISIFRADYIDTEIKCPFFSERKTGFILINLTPIYLLKKTPGQLSPFLLLLI